MPANADESALAKEKWRLKAHAAVTAAHRGADISALDTCCHIRRFFILRAAAASRDIDSAPHYDAFLKWP